LMVRAYAKGETIDCGCFGPGEAISPATLLRDGSLLAGALFLLVLSVRNRKPRSDLFATAPIPDSSDHDGLRFREI
jgi:hypothetical protein